MNNYDEILAASDGIVISRAELSMEVAPEKVVIAQKWMIEKANIAAKPCVICTQVLESMSKFQKPTRIEAQDVISAVLDGADGVMLQNETYSGANPISAVT